MKKNSTFLDIIQVRMIKLFVSAFLFVAFSSQSFGQYVPPVGIPMPSIDFTQEMPARPSDWSAEVPGYYYIDMVNGSSSASYGTPTAPRKHLPRTLSVSSYIEIEGDYDAGLNYNTSLVTTWNGTPDVGFVAETSGAIWLTQTKEEGKSGAITKVKLLLRGSNIFVSDINFKDKGRPQVGSPTNGYPASNVVVRNIDVAGGISINGDAIDSGSDNIIVYNSTFHDVGDVNAVDDEDAHIITINPFCSNIWLLDNVMHTASGAGLQIHGGGGNSANTHNIYVGNNEVYNVRQSGLWLKSGKDVVISSNHVHDIITTSWSVSKGIGAQYEPDGLWIINNHIHGAAYGIRVPSTTGTEWRQEIYAIGNVIHDINALGETVGPIETPISSWQSAAIHIHGSHDHYIYNNLVFDAPNGIDITGAGIARIKNNIILDVTESHEEGENGYHILAEILHLNDKVFIENNYFGSDMHVQVVHGKYATPESLNAVDGASGNITGTNFITAANIDALMAARSIDGIDFTQLVDNGANVDDILLTEFTSRFPEMGQLNSDIFGSVRMQETSIDIGPFESGSVVAVDIQAPTVPTNLSATAISSSQIDLTWNASTDNVGVTEYGIYKDGTLLTTTTETTYSDTELEASTTYAYSVTAYDAEGNESAQSAEVSETTADDESGVSARNLTFDDKEIKLYPNPSLDQSFTIDLSDYSSQDEFNISILDLTGKVTYSNIVIGGQLHRINDLQSSTIYFVKVQSEEINFVEKLLVK